MPLPQKRRFTPQRPGLLDAIVTTDYLSRRPRRPSLFEQEKPRTISEQLKAKFAKKLLEQNARAKQQSGFIEGVERQTQIEHLSSRISGFAKKAEQSRLTPEQEQKLRQLYLARTRIKRF